MAQPFDSSGNPPKVGRPLKVPSYIKRSAGADPKARRGLFPGRGVEPTVAAQVKKRQNLIQSKDRLFAEEDQVNAFNFFNRKTPFIRLTSGIDVNGSAASANEHVLSNGLQHYNV